LKLADLAKKIIIFTKTEGLIFAKKEMSGQFLRKFLLT